MDERVAEHLADEEISIGDYVLSGGELAAAVVIDTVARLLPGVLGNETSAAFESFQETGHGEGLLDCPHWTRPADFRGWKAPEVLLNGNHEEIRKFRKQRGPRKDHAAAARFCCQICKIKIPRNFHAERAVDEVYQQEQAERPPEFRPGDTIRVHVKIKEGDKERLQAFEGTVIARNNTGMGESITVRKVSFGQGVERIFPMNARVIDHIDVVRTGRVRRAKLYYLRGLRGKAARLKERT